MSSTPMKLIQSTAATFIFVLTFIKCIHSTHLNLTCAQIRNFVEGHNIRRQWVAQGSVSKQPPAANMMLMLWDEELAEKASKWAEKGLLVHNPDKSINSRRWQFTGENLYISTFTSNVEVVVVPQIDDALNFWFNEHSDYNFGPFSLNTNKLISHYTQMVWADSNYVGCSISQTKIKDVTSTLYVCNYGPPGNIFGQVPYSVATEKEYVSCSDTSCKKPNEIGC